MRTGMLKDSLRLLFCIFIHYLRISILGKEVADDLKKWYSKAAETNIWMSFLL